LANCTSKSPHVARGATAHALSPAAHFGNMMAHVAPGLLPPTQ
jgi:hypothetical protein